LILIYFRQTKTISMRRLLLVVALHPLFGMTAAAQYVTDWNPDADGDNTVGVNDLIGLVERV
jgi:hypothetical protein